MVLRAYFDESERRDTKEPICVGGYLFKTGDYKKFERRWSNHALRLRGRRLKHFHMTDLCAGEREYRGMSIADRLLILNQAVDAISAYAYGGVGVYFEQAEFERIAPPDWPALRGSIYTTACGMCLQTTAYWLKKWNCSLNVSYVFEDGHRRRAEADEVLTAISRDDVARKDFRYWQHAFAGKNREVGLQAADLFAWTITKVHACNGKTPSSFRPFVPPILRLAKSMPDRYKLHAFTGERLVRFVDEQLRAPAGGVPVTFGPRLPGFR